jgi:multidrug efflux pump
MGVGVIGGLVVGTGLTLYVIPALYLIISRNKSTDPTAPTNKPASVSARSEHASDPAPLPATRVAETV